jgi:hypothetical protein
MRRVIDDTICVHPTAAGKKVQDLLGERYDSLGKRNAAVGVSPRAA